MVLRAKPSTADHTLLESQVQSQSPPGQTDGEIEVVALGPIYPGATEQFAISHPDISDGADFDSRTKITINAGSYTYDGGMSGSPFTLAIPLDADTVSFKIVLKVSDYPQIPANINSQVVWGLDDEGSTSQYPTIISEGTSAQGYTAKVKANITVGTSFPYGITIQTVKVNE
jgi:hypothetical protein